MTICGCLKHMDVPGYQMEGPIGFGAEGVTWLGRDGAGAAVAVRMLSAAAPERHRLRMARLERMTTVRSPHLAQLREVVPIEQDRAAVVFEAVPGPTLATIRVGRGELSIPEAARVGSELASALQDLHAVAVTHADISPANVVLSPGTGAVLVDLAGEPAWESGTGGFAAPELAAGAVPTAAADVYALGRLVVWLVAGRDRDEVRRILTPALADDPGQRCSAEELHRILSARPGQAVQTPGAPTLAGATLREHAQREVTRRKSDHRPRHRRAPNRRPLLLTLALLALVAPVAAATLYLVPGADDGGGAPTGAAAPVAAEALPDPVTAVLELTDKRDTALNSADVAALAEVTVPASPAADRDAGLAERLAAGTLAVQGLRTEMASAEEVSADQVPSPDGGLSTAGHDDGDNEQHTGDNDQQRAPVAQHSALVRTALRASEHTVETPQGRSTVPARDMCLVLEVHHHGERWRVAHVHHC